jgi:nucleotidyl transferase
MERRERVEKRCRWWRKEQGAAAPRRGLQPAFGWVKQRLMTGGNMEIKDFLIPESFRVIDVMQRLDTLGKKTLFVAENGRLLAAVTDGDIRRWILKDGDLQRPVKEVANYQPKWLPSTERKQAYRKLKEWGVDAIPLLTGDRQIVSIFLWNNEEIRSGKKLLLPTVIMAGGFGTRLYPYTKILPKPLIPIGEIPIAEHIINRFHSFGVNRFYLVVNHKKNMIKAYFSETNKNYQIYYTDEEKPLGTGGGLQLLAGEIRETFFLTNCDILVEADYEQIYRTHQEAGNQITMVCARQNMKIPYGVVEVGERGELVAMKEKPELSFLTNTGFYVVEPAVIERLEKDVPVSFPEIIEVCRKNGERVGVYTVEEDQWLDMGQIEEMEKMEKRLTGLEMEE